MLRPFLIMDAGRPSAAASKRGKTLTLCGGKPRRPPSARGPRSGMPEEGHGQDEKMQVNQKNWQELIRPPKLEVSAGRDRRRLATLVAEPLERGFGITLGNALRR